MFPPGRSKAEGSMHEDTLPDIEMLRLQEPVDVTSWEPPSVAARKDRHFFPQVPERLYTQLAPLPGKALAVYMVLMRLSLQQRSACVSCTSTWLAQFGITPDQKKRALVCLE